MPLSQHDPDAAPGPAPAPQPAETPRASRIPRRLSRRAVLGLAGAAGVGLAAGVLGRLIYTLTYQHARYIYYGQSEGVFVLAWSPNSQNLASGGKSLQAWEAFSGNLIDQFPAHFLVLDAAWSPDGKYLACANGDGTFTVWEAASGNSLLTYCGHVQGGLRPDLPLPGIPLIGGNRLAWSSDSTRLLSTGPDHTAQVWETMTGRTLLKFGGEQSYPIRRVAWSPDERQVAAGNYTIMYVWDVTSEAHLSASWKPPAGVDALAWSPNGRYLAIASYKTVCVWEVATQRQVLAYQGHSEWVQAVIWSPDSRRVASAGFDLVVRIWEATTGQTEYIYQGHRDFWQRYFSVQAPNVPAQASHAPSTDFSALSWALTGRQNSIRPQDPILPPSCVSALAWSPDGQYIASGDSGETTGATVHVWQPG
ncbi:MAG TPA: WD40 repeat domain-containing protein [Ktedonobacterales bacterium]|nr:WD40 repeat domain-containing protein [Ktedonobacterales bacterium]